MLKAWQMGQTPYRFIDPVACSAYHAKAQYKLNRKETAHRQLVKHALKTQNVKNYAMRKGPFQA